MTFSSATVGLTIKPVYESNINNSSNSSGIKNAINNAIQIYQNEYSDNITVNIQFGYGSILGSSCDGIAGSEGAAIWVAYSLTQLKSALSKQAQSLDDIAAIASLSANNFPMSVSSILINSAQQKALGLRAANDTAIDSYICLSSAKAWDFDVKDGISSGTLDMTGVTIHEIGHSLGRVSSLPGGSIPTLMDLYRFRAPGVRSLSSFEAAYFSVDNGETNLENFATDPSQEACSWVAKSGDSFSYAAYGGVINTLTAVDYVLIDVLGYTPKAYTSAPPVVTSPSPTVEAPVAPTGLNVKVTATGKRSKLNYRDDLSWVQSANSGASQNRIYRRIGSGSWTVLATISATTSFRDSSVQRGQSYTYRVTAVNSAGLESLNTSNEVTVTVP